MANFVLRALRSLRLGKSFAARALALLIGATQLSGAATAADWYQQDIWADPNRGFYWYPTEKPVQPPEEKKEPPPKQARIQDLPSVEAIQKELDRLRDTALLQPTESNVLTYLQAQEWVMSQSSMFADVARRVAWQNPSVDGNVRQPIATYAATNQRERLQGQREQTFQQLAKTHGLVLFVRGDCQFCHDMGPVIRSLSDTYGFDVVPVTLDGGGVPGYPRPRPDNGISKFVSRGEGVRTVPALYLVANDQKSVTFIGSGALAAEEVMERIRVLATTNPGEEM